MYFLFLTDTFSKELACAAFTCSSVTLIQKVTVLKEVLQPVQLCSEPTKIWLLFSQSLNVDCLHFFLFFSFNLLRN